MPFNEVSGHSLLQRLIDKAVSSSESRELNSSGYSSASTDSDLSLVFLKELEEIAYSLAPNAVDSRSPAFLRAIEASRRILGCLISTLDIVENCSIRHIDREVPVSVPKTNTLPARANFCSLPTEILVEIFRDGCLHSTDAVVFSGINRRCREVILNAPSLWTGFRPGLSTEFYQLLVERSLPLNLSLVIYKHIKLQSFLSFVKMHYHRIGSVVINDEEPLGLFMEVFSDLPLDRLHSLRVRGALEPGFNPRFLSPLNMPNIKHFDSHWFYPDIQNSWTHKLTQCSMAFTKFDQDVAAICEFWLPNCETLNLQLGDPFSDRNIWVELHHGPLLPPPTRCYLPKLKHLRLEIWNDRALAICRNMLAVSIPTQQLESLEITLAHKLYELGDFRDGLFPLKFTELKSLKVTYQKAFQEPMDVKAPHLEHLEVYGAYGFTLSKYVSMAEYLPILKTVVFDHCEKLEDTRILSLLNELASNRPNQFEQLMLRDCSLSPLLALRLKNIAPSKLQYE